MINREDVPSSDQSATAMLEMGRSQRHQSFAQTIADKYRFVRRDDRGRLSLTFREKGAAAAALPPASITTVVQHVQLKLGLLMPLQVQLETLERRWLMQVERWLKGTDRSFDRVVKRVGERLRDEDRRQPGVDRSAKAIPPAHNPSPAAQAASGIPASRPVAGANGLPKPMSSEDRGRRAETPFIHAYSRVRPEAMTDDGTSLRKLELQVDRHRDERVEDLLVRTREEWRRAWRREERPASAAEGRHLDAGRNGRGDHLHSMAQTRTNERRIEQGDKSSLPVQGANVRNDSQVIDSERERLNGTATPVIASQAYRSQATVVMQRYLQKLNSSASLVSGVSALRQALQHAGNIADVALNARSIDGSESGAAKSRNARIMQSATLFATSPGVLNAERVHDVRSGAAPRVLVIGRMRDIHAGLAAEGSEAGRTREVRTGLATEARMADRKPSGHSKWSTQLVYAMLGRLAGERSVTIRPFLNRTLGANRIAAVNTDTDFELLRERRDARQQDAVTNPPNTKPTRTVIAREDSPPTRMARDANRVTGSQGDTRADISALHGNVVGTRGSAPLTPGMTSAPIQLRLLRRPAMANVERHADATVQQRTVSHQQDANDTVQESHARLQQDASKRPDAPRTRNEVAASTASTTDGLPAIDNPADRLAESADLRPSQSAPQHKRSLAKERQQSARGSQSAEGTMMQAYRRRDAEGRLAFSRWQLVEVEPAPDDGLGQKQASSTIRPVRSVLLVQRIRSSENHGLLYEAGEEAISKASGRSARSGDIQLIVKPASSVQNADKLARQPSELLSQQSLLQPSVQPTSEQPSQQLSDLPSQQLSVQPSARSWIVATSPSQIQRYIHRLQTNGRNPADGVNSGGAKSDASEHQSPRRLNINGLSAIAYGNEHSISSVTSDPSVRLILARRKANSTVITAGVGRDKTDSTTIREIRVEVKKQVTVQGTSSSSRATDKQQAIGQVRSQDAQELSIAVRAQANVGRFKLQSRALSALIMDGALSRSKFGIRDEHAEVGHILARRILPRGEQPLQGRRAEAASESKEQTFHIHLRLNRTDREGFAAQSSRTSHVHSDEPIKFRESDFNAGRTGSSSSPQQAKSATGTTSTPLRQARQSIEQAAGTARFARAANLSLVFAAAARGLNRLHIGTTASRFTGLQGGRPLSARVADRKNRQVPVEHGSFDNGASQRSNTAARVQSPASRSIGAMNAVHRNSDRTREPLSAAQGELRFARPGFPGSSAEGITHRNNPVANDVQSAVERSAARRISSLGDRHAADLSHRTSTADGASPGIASRARGIAQSDLFVDRPNVGSTHVRRARRSTADEVASRMLTGNAASRHLAFGRENPAPSVPNTGHRSVRQAIVQHPMQPRLSASLARNAIQDAAVVPRNEGSIQTVNGSSGIRDGNYSLTVRTIPASIAGQLAASNESTIEPNNSARPAAARMNRRLTQVNLTEAVQLRNRRYATAGRLDRSTADQPLQGQDGELSSRTGIERRTTSSSPPMHYTAARPQLAAGPSRANVLAQPAMMQHAAKTSPSQAQPVQPVMPIEPPRAAPIDPVVLQQALNQLPQLQPDVIAGKVMTAIEKKMKFQQRTRGY
ncbi:hypothetical protein ACFFSY_24405 [Paenibacillus aurantiacus]|uniref:WIAG-tail domain n=1 Tax=Paenibacillus aurantiacus TaxID=1936118 RepID=A0ABV5KV46_9BACL